MPDQNFDSVVIGGGSAGLAFARTAAGLGARVALIERAELGGTCVNRGCVPKKILWAAGRMMRDLREAHRVDLVQPAGIDFPRLIHRRDAFIRDLNANFESSLDAEGVALIRGDATLAEGYVQVGKMRLATPRTVLATGASPAPMDIPGAELLSDSRDVLSWSRVPQRIVIVGGGYIGCEFAAIFAAFGSDVTLVHDGDTLLDGFPEAIAHHVRTGLEAYGIALHFGSGLKRAARGDRGLEYTLADGQTGQSDVIVAAVGRTPNIDGLGPLAQGLAHADNGTLCVSDRFETSHTGIHAIGDVADRLPLTPVATADGTALAHILHGAGAQPTDLDAVATTAFVYPPAAHVGTVSDDTGTASALRPLPHNILAPDDTAKPALYRLGFDDKGGLTGAQIVADGAEDMIALLAAMMTGRPARSAFETATAIHPSFAEEFF